MGVVCMYVCSVKLHSKQYLIRLCEIKKIGVNNNFFFKNFKIWIRDKKKEQIDFSECSEDIEVGIYERKQESKTKNKENTHSTKKETKQTIKKKKEMYLLK